MIHAADEAINTDQRALAAMLLDRMDASGLRGSRDVDLSYLDARKRIASDSGDSLALLLLPHRPDENLAALHRSAATGGDTLFPEICPTIIPASTDPLLAFAQSQQITGTTTRASLTASFPPIDGVSLLAL